MEFNEEKKTFNESEPTDMMQEEIRFFAEEPDDTDLNETADLRAAAENADEEFACRVDDGFADDMDFSVEMEDAEGTAAASLRERLNTLRENCRALSARIADDMKATNNNPYIRSTTTYRYEILRNSKDTEPVDVFEFQRTSGASLRAMAITAAVVAAADVAFARIFRKK